MLLQEVVSRQTEEVLGQFWPVAVYKAKKGSDPPGPWLRSYHKGKYHEGCCVCKYVSCSNVAF